MATKITGYKIFTSTGGNTCIQCGTRMRKGLPYISPVSGKRVIKVLKGKSICLTCITELSEKIKDNIKSIPEKEIDLYNTRRFIAHLD